VGVPYAVIVAALEAIADLLGPERTESALRLLDRVSAR